MATLHEILDNLGGALRIAGNLISQPITRSHYRFWGATKEDQQRTLPGDERVPDPHGSHHAGDHHQRAGE